jgi:hypothetical protein
MKKEATKQSWIYDSLYINYDTINSSHRIVRKNPKNNIHSHEIFCLTVKKN